jgi:hypothetical protein
LPLLQALARLQAGDALAPQPLLIEALPGLSLAVAVA